MTHTKFRIGCVRPPIVIVFLAILVLSCTHCLAQFVQIMGTKVGRVALFGIPLQQEWSYDNSDDFAPTYYLQTDAPLYYYSFTDAYIAMAYRSLSKQSRLGLIR